MLIGEVFEEFISVVQENNQYTIGLVNDKSQVILCSNRDVIGMQVDMNHPDMRNVYYEVTVKGMNYGYLWVHGADENLSMIARLLQESLTVRLMYEINQADLHQKVTKEDELMRYLLNSEAFDRERVLELLDELELDRNVARVAILAISRDVFNVKDVTRLKMKPDSKQVIYSLINNKTLMLFKDLPETMRDKQSVKAHIEKYIQSLKEWDLNDCDYYVGSIQHKLTKYAVGYETCVWMKNNLSPQGDKTIHFSDHIMQYFSSQISTESVLEVFEYYQDTSRQLDIDELNEIVDQLIATDFNLTHAADALYLHKNTLIYKLKKYEEVFQIDIRNSFEGKILLMMLSQSLKKYQKYKQAGDSL